MRCSHPDTIPLLQQALGQRRPRDPGAGVEENAVARNAARSLGKLAPASAIAIPDLLDTLEDADHGLREAAARTLGEATFRCCWSIFARSCRAAAAAKSKAFHERLVEHC